MSNRKNNKSKKTSNKNHSQNDFNSFRMEALEPRLLMAADLPTALHEQLEAMQVDTVVSGFTNNNSQLQSEVSFLGGNLKSLSNLVKDSGSTLQGTLSGKLEAALDTLQPSGSFGDLSALADALDAASVSLGDDWTAGLDATAQLTVDLIEQAVARWPGVKLAKNQATYLAWIDVSALGLDEPVTFFEQAGVGLSPGAQFGDGQFVRLNFGCTRARLTQALARMEKAILQRSI